MGNVVNATREVYWLDIWLDFFRTSGTCGLALFKRDFINLLEGNLSAIAPST